MTWLRSLLRWVFVRGPAAFYRFAESDSWFFVPVLLAAMAVVGGLGAGIGALIGIVAGKPVYDAAFNGLMIGFVVLLGWMVLAIGVIVVLWFRDVTSARAAAGQEADPGIAGGWRRGRPLIPANAVGFFALLTVAFGVVSGLHWYGARSWDERTAIVDGSVVAVHVPSVMAKSPNKVDIRYTVDGIQHTIRIDADPGDHFLRMGDTTPVEYATADPNHARAVWAVEGNRSDGIAFGIAAGVCAVLTAVVGIAYLLGPRQRGRH